MAGNTGDICRVSLEYANGGVTNRNMFFYRLADPGTATYLDGLLTTFQTTVLTPLAAALCTAFTFTELVATNIFTGDEVIDVTPTPAAGSRAVSGDVLAPFISVMLILERQNSRVRNGRKFFPLSLETDVAGSFLVAGTVTLFNAVATGIQSDLNAGAVDLFQPAIVGRIPYTTATGKVAYRLPTSQGEMGENYSLVDTARVINRTTTMNSRKFWRGE